MPETFGAVDDLWLQIYARKNSISCMTRKRLEKTLEFVQQIDRARDSKEIGMRLLETVRSLGFRHVLAGTIPGLGSSKAQQQSHVLLHEWLVQWSERYFSRGYLFVDPAIRRVLSKSTPFFWTELAPLCRTALAAPCCCPRPCLPGPALMCLKQFLWASRSESWECLA